MRGDTEPGQNGRKQNARLVLEDGEVKGKKKKRLHWRMGYNRDFAYRPQSKQSVQESQFELVPKEYREQSHKGTMLGAL